MGIFVPKTFETILQRQIDRVVARSKLSDLTDTSGMKTVLAATAREMADGYLQMKYLTDLFSIDRAAGDDLDERAKDYNPVVISRVLATQATGALQFSRVVPAMTTLGLVTIPIGTRVEVPSASPELVCITTSAVTLPVTTNSGGSPVTQLSGLAASVMEAAGARGNVGAGVLVRFRGFRPAGVDAVTNPSVFVGGSDKETDDSFRARIKALVATLSRCTPQALEVAASTVILPSGQHVVFAKTVEDPVQLGKVYLYIDDGSGAAESTVTLGSTETLTSGPEFPSDMAQGGERYLYTDHYPIKDSVAFTLLRGVTALTRVSSNPVGNEYTLNAASGQVYLGTALTAGQTVTLTTYTWFIGLIAEVQKVIDGDPANRTTYPGWRAAGVLVLVRVPTILPVTVTADITVRDGFGQMTVAASVRAAIAAYVNGLGIGVDVVRSEMIERAMAVEGMYDITISSPASNIVVLFDELPRILDAGIDGSVSLT